MDRADATQHAVLSFDAELRIAIENDIGDSIPVVHSFEAIDKRTALHGNSSRIGRHLRMGFDPLDFHGQIQFDDVSRLPGSRDHRITGLHAGFGLGLAIDFPGGARTPLRNAQPQFELLLRWRRHGQSHAALPRVFRLLSQNNPCIVVIDGGFPCGVQVDHDAVLTDRIQVARQGGQESHDIRRTTGARIERLAVVSALGRERINVEEMLAVHTNAREHTVVDHAFEHVGVLRVGVQQIQAVGPQGQSDGRARFAVGRVVGQFIRCTEGLSFMTCANSTGYIHLVSDHIVPQSLHGRHEFFITRIGRHIGHATVQIHRAHRVSDDLRLLRHGAVVLAVLAIQFRSIGRIAAGL